MGDFANDAAIFEFLDRHKDRCGMYHRETLQQALDATARVIADGIPGDLVEIGVYRGIMCMAMAAKLIQLGATDRTIHMYDTFEGMTEPTSRDVRADSGTRANLQDAAVACRCGLEDVRANMALVGYPSERVVYHKGDIMKNEVVPDQIAFLRLDTDFYDSTRYELEAFAPRVAPGGVITQDDYGYWRGATEAVDEYLQANPREAKRLSPHGIWWPVPAA